MLSGNREGRLRLREEGKPMQTIAQSLGLPGRTVPGTIEETMPDPVHKPPGRPPGEPIIIRIPPRTPEAPEIDRDEDEEDPEIKKPPGITPEMPPPPAPWERADWHRHRGSIDA
jgi:hypothetical protein